MNPRVIDLSHHNTVSPDLKGAAAAGVIAVIHKMTEGTSMVDEKAKSRKFLADDAGLKFGLYHFLHAGDMKAQAQFFFNKAQGIADDNTLWACDFEVPNVKLSQVADFMEALAALTGKPPVLYSGSFLKDAIGRGESAAELVQYRLWLCHYYGPSYKLPKGWEKYWLWQYSDKGTVPGTDVGKTDVNYFEGEDSDLIW